MTTELFIDSKPLFKQAQSIGTPLPDDSSAWPQQVLEELHRQHPFMGKYIVDVMFEKINPAPVNVFHIVFKKKFI
jgi:hypothetical protein